MTTDIEARFLLLADAVNADADLVRRGARLSGDILVGVGARDFIVSLDHGRVHAVEPATRLMRPFLFSVRAGADDWRKHWQAAPPPGWHDLLAMTKRGVARVEGNLLPFMQHLQVVKDVLAAPREGRGQA
jgi:hypothetical protein